MLSEVWRPMLLVFLSVSPVALSLPLVAEAQEVAKIYRIGHVSLMTPDGMAPYVHEFEKGLRDLGYVKGQHYVIAIGAPKRAIIPSPRNWLTVPSYRCTSASISSN